MHVVDDGAHLVITNRAPWYVRAAAVFFSAMALLYFAIIVHGIVVPKSVGSVDCDRARGTCEITVDSRAQSAPIADVQKAVSHHDSGHKNSSASDSAALLMKNGSELSFGEPSYHAGPAAEYRAAVAGVNAFLGDPSQPHFHAQYTASDDDWAFMIFFAIMSPLAAFTFFRLAVAVSVDVDRAQRSVRVVRNAMFRKSSVSTMSFADVRDVVIGGNARWAQLSIRSRDAVPTLVGRFPRGVSSKAELRDLSLRLSQTMGVPLDVAPSVRQTWQLGV